MLLHRYNSIDFFMGLDFRRGLELIRKAEEQEKDARIFQQWVAQLPVMALTGEAVGYREYKDRVTLANVDLRPTAEILAELDEIEAQMNGGEEVGA